MHIQLNAQSSSGQPVWWYGGAVGPNFNFYSTSIQHPNASITTPSEFTGGSGSGTFFAPMIEYRPNAIWGGMLAFGFDGRGGSFDNIPKAALSTSMNYLSLEPSLRYSPFDFGLYFFGGPRLAFNIAQSFTYVSTTQPQTNGDWSGIHGAVFGLQLGAGYEFSVTPRRIIFKFISHRLLQDLSAKDRGRMSPGRCRPSVPAWRYYLPANRSGETKPRTRAIFRSCASRDSERTDRQGNISDQKFYLF